MLDLTLKYGSNWLLICPKCGHYMHKSEDHSDRLHQAHKCGNLECLSILKIRLVRCCNCTHCKFDEKDSLFHCKPMNMGMFRIEYETICQKYEQREAVKIDWADDGIVTLTGDD